MSQMLYANGSPLQVINGKSGKKRSTNDGLPNENIVVEELVDKSVVQMGMRAIHFAEIMMSIYIMNSMSKKKELSTKNYSA